MTFWLHLIPHNSAPKVDIIILSILFLYLETPLFFKPQRMLRGAKSLAVIFIFSYFIPRFFLSIKTCASTGDVQMGQV